MKSKTLILLPMSALLASCACKDSVPETIPHHGRQPIGIQSRTYWNDTGITLHKGRTYQFQVSGTWKDWTYQATPAGPACPLINALMFPARPLLRYSPFHDIRANYFQPIGTIGREKGKALPTYAFIIRDGMNYNAPASGTLYVFANDAPWEMAYANNKGKLSLNVSEIP